MAPNSPALNPPDYLVQFGAMLESYHKLQLKPKSVPEFKNALQLIWSVVCFTGEGNDNVVKDCRKLLQDVTMSRCVSASNGHFAHAM